MFFRLYTYQLKTLSRSKLILFWTFLFPFILGTFFYLAFSGINKSITELNPIPVAVVENENYSGTFKEMIGALGGGEDKILELRTTSDSSRAENWLSAGEIEGVISSKDNKPMLKISKNGINQTILKNVLDQYLSLATAAETAISYNPEILKTNLLENLNKNYVKDVSSEKVDFMINYFFTLIAMACLYGGMLALIIVKNSEANLSKVGARVCVSGTNKAKVLVSGLLAGYTVQLITLLLLFLYLIFVLHVNFGAKITETVLLSAVGCLAGAALGTFVAVSNRLSEGFKTAILISVTMICCFFSGMMGVVQMKTFFDAHLPIFAAINPVNNITNGLYALYAYDTLDVYWENLMRIAIFAAALIILSIFFTRRRKYASL